MALAVAGAAATLALTDAPPYAVYQHLRLWSWAAVRPLALGVVVAQAAVVLALASRWTGPLLRQMQRVMRRGGLLLLVGALLFSSAIPTWNVVASLVEMFTSLALMAIALGNVVLVADAIPEGARQRLQRWVGERLTLPGAASDAPRPFDRRLPYWLAGFTLALGCVISVFVFDAIPHIDDSVSYLFQAKYFAAGHLTLPAPPDSASFHMDQVIIDRGRWFGYGFPGWPLLLAAGVRIGASWIVNPLIGAVTVLLVHALLRRTHDVGTAHAGAALLSASPWFHFMNGELLGQPAALMWMVVALLGMQMERQRSDGRGALLAGLGTGALFLSRPLDGAIASVVLAAWALGFLGERRLLLRSMIVMVAVVGIMGVLGLAYDHAVTGDAFKTAHRVWMDRTWGAGSDRLGFGADIGNRAWPNLDPLPGHGPVDVVLNLNKNFFQTNVDLYGWALGSLLLAGVALLSKGWRRGDGYLLALLVAVPAGYSLYWFSGGPDHGARYWYLILLPLLVLSVRGATVIGGGASDGAQRSALSFIAPIAVVISMVTFMPWRAVTKYRNYRDVTPVLNQLAEQKRLQHALVFVRSPQRRDYQSAFIFNPVDLHGPANVFARYLDAASRARVAAALPDRTVWVFDRPSEESTTWQVLGPYAAGASPP
jgi:hypothetical protein